MRGVRALVLTIGALACARAPQPEPPGPIVHPWTGLAALLDSAVAAGAAPGAVVGISWRGRHYTYGTGRLGLDDRRRPGAGTVYDLASVTKVVALTTLAMQAVQEDRLTLDTPLLEYLAPPSPAWADRVTMRHLLTHTSGLPAHRRLWELAADAEAARTLVRQTPLDTAPGTRTLYSDLGLILAGEVLEQRLGASLDALVATRITRPMGLVGTRYRPPRSWRRRTAPTERDPWRGRLLRAEVHDENAAFLGGVAGHAGLFGTTADLLRFGEWLIGAVRSEGEVLSGERWLIRGEVAREFTRLQELVPGSTRALGWDTPDSLALPGIPVPPHTVWHTGFTGTAIWVDPEDQLVLVLLTNRVHPTRQNTRHIALRRAVATLVFGRISGR